MTSTVGARFIIPKSIWQGVLLQIQRNQTIPHDVIFLPCRSCCVHLYLTAGSSQQNILKQASCRCSVYKATAVGVQRELQLRVWGLGLVSAPYSRLMPCPPDYRSEGISPFQPWSFMSAMQPPSLHSKVKTGALGSSTTQTLR